MKISTVALAEDTTRIPVMESFMTLQGEGFHTGKAAYFIRTAGCDVGCHWCDVKESWEASDHRMWDTKSLLQELDGRTCEIVVITGGEPTMYNLEPLTSALYLEGRKVHLETSGAHPLSGSWDWICFSPKKFRKPLPTYYEVSHELKVVIYNKSDFEFAELHADRMHEDTELFLQPEWSVRHKVLPLIVDYVKDNPKWRVSLQTHKYLNIP